MIVSVELFESDVRSFFAEALRRVVHSPTPTIRYPVMITTRSRLRFENWVSTPPPEVRNDTSV
jgi:hypothetical protein